jgi:7-cyano-7-deazaguanine synthase
MSTDSALIVLSGGQDSTTALYWALDRFDPAGVQAITFDYGQRHRVELDSARRVAEFAGIPQVVLPIDTFRALGGNALTDAEVPVGAMPDEGLPNTFVPGRNLVFLTFAAAFAYQRGIADIVTGVAQTDYSGYPDCRESTLIALERALSLGMDAGFRLHAPLMHLSKKETVQMAERLGALPAMALTHTCYEGRRPPCGQCPACRLRAKGFEEAGIADPLLAGS